MVTTQVSRRPLDPPVLAATTALVLVTLVLMPFGHIQGRPTVSFMPALISVVAVFDLLSVYLLLGGYRDRGDKRLLLTAATYAWSLVLMGGYALAFPGAVSQSPPLALTPSTAPYLYVLWHTTFPVLLALTWAPWPHRFTRTTPPADRTRVLTTLVPIAVVGAMAVVGLVATNAQRLPTLIIGLDTSRMTTLTAPVALPVVLVALVVSHRRTRGRTGPERWIPVIVLTCFCDLVLTYVSGHRYSVGWYGGRSLTLVAAGVLLVSMLATFRRLSAVAERDAAYDALTNLLNRRSASLALDQLIGRARGSGEPLSVVTVDLDHFKRINDTYGHETGDAVLATVGGILVNSCRAADLVARVGGEEFLLVLPHTDDVGAMALAEKVRRAVSAADIPGLRHPLTASLGVTALHPDDHDQADMLRRADRALYRVKEGGRDRVEVARIGPGPLVVTVDVKAGVVV